MSGKSSMPRAIQVVAALVLMLVGAVAIASQVSADAGELTIGNLTKLQGEEAAMALELSDVDAPGLGAWIIDIDYDDDILSAVSCSAPSGAICNTSFGPSTVRVVGASADGIEGDVLLSTIRFRCDDEGASALGLTAVELADATNGQPQDIDADIVHGTINCVEAGISELEGDANCDGVVNSVDALIVLQFVARLRTSVPCPDLADVDDNGRISAIDAALILQIHAGLI
jgi:hypothetical protein